MKKSFKSFLKYVLFSGFLSVSAVASPIASPGTSTVYSGTNSSLIYSPTVTSGSSGGNCNFTLLVDQHTPGTYTKTVDLSSFTGCGSNATLVIKAAGGKGGTPYGGLGGITTLRIPLSTFIQEYGTQVTFYYLVNMGGGGGGNGYGGGGGESLVSLNNWPWNNGVPLAIGGGGGGGGWIYYSNSTGYSINLDGYGGNGGGGNDAGLPAWFGGGGGGYGYGGGGGNGYDGYGGNGGGGYDWGGGGGGGYGGGGGGYDWGGGGGGGGYCNTSLGICQASDWTNGGGNPGPGYVKIYIEDGVETLTNTTLP